MIALSLNSPTDAVRGAGLRAKNARLAQNLTQGGLAVRAGVSLGSLKLFESRGKASFETVARIAFALGSEEEIDRLFPPQAIVSMDDVVEAAPRQRGRRR